MDTATALSLSRVALGAVAYVAPRLSLRGAFLDASHAQAPFLFRLFGARDLALGALTLLASAEATPAMLRVGIAVDASDAVAAVLAYRGRSAGPLPTALIATTASGAVVSGVLALRQDRARV